MQPCIRPESLHDDPRAVTATLAMGGHSPVAQAVLHSMWGDSHQWNNQWSMGGEYIRGSRRGGNCMILSTKPSA